jgi:hypothetical protein
MALVGAAASLLVWDSVVKLLAPGNVPNQAQQEKLAEKRIRDLLATADDGEGIRSLLTSAGASEGIGMNLQLIEEALRARACALVDVEVEVDTAAFRKHVPRLRTMTIEGWVTELGVVGGVAFVRLEYRAWNVKRRRAAVCRFAGILLLLFTSRALSIHTIRSEDAPGPNLLL